MRLTVPGVRTTVLIAFFLSLSFFASAQSITSGNGKYEFGLGLGPLFFLGDLGGNYGEGTTLVKDVNLPLTKMAKGIYANVYPTEWLGFRVAANHGVLEGDDAHTNTKGGAEQYRKDRNLKFKSTLLEAYFATELYPTYFLEKFDGLTGKLRPYGLLGIGMIKFNPKGEYFNSNGSSEWVYLKPLRLEGQGMKEYADRKEYKLTSIEIPMGIGAKFYIKENMYVGMEILHRKTFTDYIDDVSTNYIDAQHFDPSFGYLNAEQATMANQLYYRQNFMPGGTLTRPGFVGEQRGDPTENDSFFSSIFRMGWRLNDKNSAGGRAARQLRCPSFY